MFIRPADELSNDRSKSIQTTELQIPAIDLSGVHKTSDGHNKVVNGIPSNMLDEMILGIRAFHEQDTEVKSALYTRDRTKRVRFESNYDLYESKAANWKGTLNMSRLVTTDHVIEADEIPAVCRYVVFTATFHIVAFNYISNNLA